jgi:hypothetical protein
VACEKQYLTKKEKSHYLLVWLLVWEVLHLALNQRQTVCYVPVKKKGMKIKILMYSFGFLSQVLKGTES